MDPESELAARARLWEVLWPILAEAVLEFRCVAESGRLSSYLLMRVRGVGKRSTLARLKDVADAVVGLTEQVAPFVGLRPLGRAELDAALAPFEIGEGGDLIRREVEVRTSDGTIDIPLPLVEDRGAAELLARHMRSTTTPVMTSVAAGPTEIDELESRLLDAELNELAQARLSPSLGKLVGFSAAACDGSDQTEPAALRIETAESALGHRIALLQRLGFLRLSVAAAGNTSLAFRGLAQYGLGWAGGALDYVAASNDADLLAFSENLAGIDFKPWGKLVEDREERRSISDCYLASLDEIAQSAWFPPAAALEDPGFELLTPAPRSVPAAVPRDGLAIGGGRHAFRDRPVALSDADRSRHTYIIGQTGTGKSTLLLRMAEADIEAGRGVCVIDPHGDLVDSLMTRIPLERAEDVIVFDPTDVERPVPFNLFQASSTMEQDFVIQQTIAILYRLYDPGRQGIVGPRFEHWLRNAALTTMADPLGGTFLDLPRLFTDADFRARKLRFVTDPVVRSFWIDELGSTSDFHKSEMLGWVISKWGAFLSNSMMRNILGQQESAFRMREVMDEGRILLVKLPKGRIGEINALLLGMIFVSHIQLAALGRGDVPADKRRPFSLYVDEFQSFALSSFDELVAEARKYGVSLTLANQHVRQIPDAIRAAVFGNVGNLCVFRLGFEDAETLAEQLPGWAAEDIVRLENHRMVVRMGVDGRVQQPFDVFTTAPGTDTAHARRSAEAIRTLSRVTFGRPREYVERVFEADWQLSRRVVAEDGRAAEGA